MMKYVKTPRGLTLVLDGRPQLLPSAAPRFAEIERACIAGNEPLVRLLLAEGTQGVTEAVALDARYAYEHGVLRWKEGQTEVLVPGALAAGHVRAALGGYGLQGLSRLVESVNADPARLGLVERIGTRLSASGAIYGRAALVQGSTGDDVLVFPEGSKDGVPALITAASLRNTRDGLRAFATPATESSVFLSPDPGRAIVEASVHVDAHAFNGREWTTLATNVGLFIGADHAESALKEAAEARVYLSGTDYVIWVGHNSAASVEVWTGREGDEVGVSIGRFSSLEVARKVLQAKDGEEGEWAAIRRNGRTLAKKEF